MPEQPTTSAGVCELVARKSPDETCILFFSRGKDSIAAYIQLRRYFRRIVPVFYYLVPGLEFEEESLKYYEGVIGEHIIRLPNPGLYDKLASGLYQPPWRIQAIDDLQLPSFNYDDLSRVVMEDNNLSYDTFTAVGVRQDDSMTRRSSIKQRGAINYKRKAFYPVYDWHKADLIREIGESGIKLPIDYKVWGRTFDGLDARFLGPMREHFPRDYARVLEFFPFAGSSVKRMEYRAKWHAANGTT